jgi:hypothetical protein
MPRVTFSFAVLAAFRPAARLLRESGLDSLWHDHEESSQVVLEADRMLFSRKVP